MVRHSERIVCSTAINSLVNQMQELQMQRVLFYAVFKAMHAQMSYVLLNMCTFVGGF